MMLIDAVIYGILTWYLENVFPGIDYNKFSQHFAKKRMYLSPSQHYCLLLKASTVSQEDGTFLFKLLIGLISLQTQVVLQ